MILKLRLLFLFLFVCNLPFNLFHVIDRKSILLILAYLTLSPHPIHFQMDAGKPGSVGAVGAAAGAGGVAAEGVLASFFNSLLSKKTGVGASPGAAPGGVPGQPGVGVGGVPGGMSPVAGGAGGSPVAAAAGATQIKSPAGEDCEPKTLFPSRSVRINVKTFKNYFSQGRVRHAF